MRKDLNLRLRRLPAVGELLQRPELKPDLHRPRWAIVAAVRAVLDDAREAVRAGASAPTLETILGAARERALVLASPRLDRAVNATGVVIHTNLGRAPLSRRALARVMAVAGAYSNLEYDLDQGRRGSRYGIVDDLLCRLTGAEAAMVVNNNAAAVLLALSVLAAGREVVVSRGELVEIGGSFRIPDILVQSGCRLKEVGTTNRTHLGDYERAVGEETALLLKVHPSNFRVVGFTASVSTTELVALGKRLGLPVMEDLGSGCFLDLGAEGLPGEPTAAQSVAAGLDLVTMSGDKLLGGPQAGILLGRKEIIAACRRHPLARAIRVDKMCLAALEGTLRSYLDGTARQEIPVIGALAGNVDEVAERARSLAARIEAAAPGLAVALEPDVSRVGGGSFPDHQVPTVVVAVRPPGGPGRLEAALRRHRPPVIARRRDGALVLDPRTLLAGDDEVVVAAIRAGWEAHAKGGAHGQSM